MTSATLNGRPSTPPRATRPKISSTKKQDGSGKNVEYASTAAWGDVYEAAARGGDPCRRRGDLGRARDPGMTASLFLRLYPLLRKPIHPGHIMATTRAKGKPYESDGVRSVQVLIDRMNNVLTPIWWRVTRQYTESGQLCLVTVRCSTRTGPCSPKVRATAA
jgi:hypothetical protein